MYHHNLTPLIDDRYVGFWTHENYEYWLDFGPEGERYDEPIFCYTGTSEQGYFTGSLGMWNGANEITVNGETYVIKLQGGQDNASAVYTDKYNAKGGTAIKGVNVNGKPTVCGNYLFVAERIFGEIYVYDISYLTDENSNKTSAVLLGTIKVDGNPDLIFTDGTAVYIPLGYQGMLVIDTTKAFSENAEN